MLSSQILHDSHWNASIGKADWVIVTAVDELLYYVDLKEYLASCTDLGVTVLPAIGFQMISDFYPVTGVPITEQIKTGAYFSKMNKLSIFNPNKIIETNYSPGRHFANPKGNIKFPDKDILLNLHYKYLSFDQTFARHKELNEKLRGLDKSKNWGHRYGWTLDQFQKDWEGFQSAAIEDVIKLHDLDSFLGQRIVDKWWR